LYAVTALATLDIELSTSVIFALMSFRSSVIPTNKTNPMSKQIAQTKTIDLVFVMGALLGALPIITYAATGIAKTI
jgi:hypothetical protein